MAKPNVIKVRSIEEWAFLFSVSWQKIQKDMLSLCSFENRQEKQLKGVNFQDYLLKIAYFLEQQSCPSSVLRMLRVLTCTWPRSQGSQASGERESWGIFKDNRRSISSLFVTFNTVFNQFVRVTFRQNSQKMTTVIVIVKNLRSYVTISGSSSFPVAILDSQAMINDANFKLDFCSFLATGTGNFCGETVDLLKNNRKMKYLSENIAFRLIFLLDKVTGLRKHGCRITGARARPCPDSRPSVRITPLRHFASSPPGASVLRQDQIVPRLETPLILCDCHCY